MCRTFGGEAVSSLEGLLVTQRRRADNTSLGGGFVKGDLIDSPAQCASSFNCMLAALLVASRSSYLLTNVQRHDLIHVQNRCSYPNTLTQSYEKATTSQPLFSISLAYGTISRLSSRCIKKLK